MKKLVFIAISVSYIASASPLYERCSTCHGINGEKHSLNLTRSIAGMKKKDVVKILTAYRAGQRDEYGFGSMMKGQAGKLSDGDIDELSAYIESLPPTEVIVKTDVEKESTAEKIFEKCAICHGSNGEKKSLGVSRRIAGMKADDTIKILEQYRVGKRDIYSYGNMMRGQATKLSHENIKKVASYIESLPPVKSDDEKTQAETKKISQDEIDYNKFMDEYFKNSKNPNETFESAKKRYEEHKKLKGMK